VRVKPKSTAPTDATLAPGLRRYLYFTSATTGAAVMIVQILGAKMLSPFLGTSHFVWTAQIAVTLVALACGYYAGGWLVDRALKPGRIYAAIIVAGAYLALSIPFIEKVAYGFLHFDLAVGSLLASAFLFFIPLSLLAMVGPFFIRVLANSMNSMGGSIGRLSAISTFGSFLGTVLIGYLLIPFLPNSTTMYLTALVLMTLSVIYFVGWGRAGSGSGSQHHSPAARRRARLRRAARRCLAKHLLRRTLPWQLQLRPASGHPAKRRTAPLLPQRLPHAKHLRHQYAAEHLDVHLHAA
jgi:MFS family permease